jgi:hypothetical protein
MLRHSARAFFRKSSHPITPNKISSLVSGNALMEKHWKEWPAFNAQWESTTLKLNLNVKTVSLILQSAMEEMTLLSSLGIGDNT